MADRAEKYEMENTVFILTLYLFLHCYSVNVVKVTLSSATWLPYVFLRYYVNAIHFG
jgi:hypothetical protein